MLAKHVKVDARSGKTSEAELTEALRRRILRGDLVPGQRLIESELCETFGASRFTVRNALANLEREELVDRVRNRSAQVRVYGIEEALQIAEVRMVIESLCVARAAERIGERDIVKLRKLAEELKSSAEANDGRRFGQLTDAVLDTYLRVAEQRIAAEELQRLRARGTRHRFRLTLRPGRARTAVPFWLERIDAICRRDPDAAQAAVRAHFLNVQAAMRAASDDHAFIGSYD